MPEYELGKKATSNRVVEGVECSDVMVLVANSYAGRELAGFRGGYSSPDPGSDISRLRGLVRPPTVAGFVVPVWVNPIKRHSFRPVSHVGVEVLKGLPPTANRDTTLPVMPVLRRFRVQAALPHSKPRLVGSGFGFAVRGFLGSHQFALQASAGRCVTGSKVLRADNALCPAIAAAKPKCRFRFGWRPLNDRVSTESKSCKVYQFAHGAKCSTATIYGEVQ